MAWWRERFEELDRGFEPPPEPRLRGASELIQTGISGAELAQLEDAWAPLLDPFPWGDRQADGLELRGRILFRLTARRLESDPIDIELAGALWSLVDGARHCSDAGSRAMLLERAGRLGESLPRAPRGPLCALTTMAAVAAHDALGRPAGARRGLAALAHRYRGIFPRS